MGQGERAEQEAGPTRAAHAKQRRTQNARFCHVTASSLHPS